MKVSLHEIVRALQESSDEHYFYLDRQTGEVELFSKDILGLVEGARCDKVLAWQEREFEMVKTFFAVPDRFEKLPTKWDIHEWEIMREFASAEPAGLSDELQNVIRGPGAFHCFKDTLRRYRRSQDWYDFLDRALQQIAIDWCDENGIEYCD